MADRPWPSSLARTRVMRPPSVYESRLFRKYAVYFVALVGATLIASGASSLFFAYQQNRAALFDLQREKAAGAASRIEGYVREIEHQIGWTRLPRSPTDGALDSLRLEYLKSYWARSQPSPKPVDGTRTVASSFVSRGSSPTWRILGRTSPSILPFWAPGPARPTSVRCTFAERPSPTSLSPGRPRNDTQGSPSPR